MQADILQFLDRFNTPIIATDRDKNVCYKNISAKKNIPSPRLHSNIVKYLEKDAMIFENNRSVRIETMKKAHFYKRAVVTDYENGDYEIWIFCAGIQYYKPDSNFFSDKADINKLIELPQSCFDEDTEQKHSLRYDRLSEYLGRIVTALDVGVECAPYNLSQIAKITRDFTETALARYNRRFGFENFVLESSPMLSIDTLSYINLYVNLLSMMLRMGASREISIKIHIRQRKLAVELTGYARNSVNKVSCFGIEELSLLFPSELFNFAYVRKFAELYGASLDFSLSDRLLKFVFEVPIIQTARLRSPYPNKELEKEIADKFMSALSEIVL